MENQKKIINREYLVSLVRKWGDVNTDGILDPSCQIYSDSTIEGFIGYRVEAKHAVVYGDPICAPSEKAALARLFQDYCSKNKLGVVYTMASEEFAEWATKNLFSILIEFGENLVLNPLCNPIDRTGAKAGLVRKKVKQALQQGVVVKEYIETDPQIEHQIEDLAKNWQKSRYGPQIYLAQITLFNDRLGKRWFYAIFNEKIVGILLLNELQSRKGWLLNNVMSAKDAPHGVSELLIISSLQVLEKENCQSVIVGPVPRKQLGKIRGLGGFFSKIIHWSFLFARKFFHLHGQGTFWEKFQPSVNSSYLIFPQNNLSFSSLRAILKAFNVNSIKS